jgi:hypothetical protein
MYDEHICREAQADRDFKTYLDRRSYVQGKRLKCNFACFLVRHLKRDVQKSMRCAMLDRKNSGDVL